MAVINQKEYLKKYLSSGGSGDGDKKKKRKKKKVAGISDRVKIIDDDVDISQLTSIKEAVDLLNTNEDAPQIVGVIDERPPHLRVNDYRQGDLWKPVGSTTSDSIPNPAELENRIRPGNVDSSPPRREKDGSTRATVDDDHTPPRRRTSTDNSPPRRKNHSPQRQGRHSPDNTPPRKSRTDSTSSPVRRSRWDVDNSPPRRSTYGDSSPPRKMRRNSDNSPPRRSPDGGRTPKPLRRGTPPLPPSAKAKPVEENRPRKLLPGNSKGKYLIPAKRMTKTLDGKTAGLQNARDLVQETEAFRKREDDLFKSMPAEVSGANASAVLRDRKTGKIRDPQKEAEERREREKREAEEKEKYSRWGRGLKQVQDYEERLAADLHEMNKPLARYADDEDLERYLKERELPGDPMLEFIRRKKRGKKGQKEGGQSSEPEKPRFKGEFMPNRFGIVPGYRWDGVDRSNGYERRWFQIQNSKRAEQEEIYKWSTEDM